MAYVPNMPAETSKFTLFASKYIWFDNKFDNILANWDEFFNKLGRMLAISDYLLAKLDNWLDSLGNLPAIGGQLVGIATTWLHHCFYMVTLLLLPDGIAVTWYHCYYIVKLVHNNIIVTGIVITW